MSKKSKIKTAEYPLVWQKDDFFIKIYASIPNISTGIIISTGKAIFAVDPGDGFLRDLNKDIGPQKIMQISDIFISHGHHDHIGGFWSLFTYLSVMGRKKPLSIYYPAGCAEVESIYKAFIQVHRNELTFDILMNPVKDWKTIRRKNITVKPFEVNHREISADGKFSKRIPSLGFKFIYDGKSICYGGDSAYCETLADMAKDSDLAIIEAGAEDDENSENHMSFVQAQKIGRTAKEYFLVHIPE